MKQIITFLLFFLISITGISQSQVQVEIDVKVFDYVTDKKLSGANVEVFDGGTSIKSGITPTNGNIKFVVPSGKKYKVEVSKPGKVSRYFFIDSKGIEAELIQGKNKITIGPDIKLFDQVGNIDYSFVENNPITEFYFDLTSNSVEYDQAMANKMAKKIESLIAESQKKDGQNDALYQKAIEGADGWYKEKKYDLALAKYEEAALLKPKEQYPKDRIKELDALVKSQKQANLADKQKEEQYKALIASGDALRDQKKYAEAIAKYQEALKIKDEQYAKDQIESANKSLAAAKSLAETEAKYKSIIASADMFFNQKSFVPAREKYQEALSVRPNDEYAKKRITEIDSKQGAEEKKKKYAFFIAEGDELKAANKYEQAKDMYVQAIALDNTQQYPKDKIKELDLLIADAKKNNESAQKFNAVMKVGDDLMAANKLVEAKAKYTEAGLMDPTKTKPKENIKKIEDILQAQADAKKNKAKITELLKDGNAKFAKNDLANAKVAFQEVLKLESTNAEATAKLKEISTKENQLQSQAQLDEKFKNLKAKGIVQFKAENYTEAQQSFSEAKAIKSDSEIDKYLSDISGKMANEQVFQKLIQEAKILEATNLDGAITKYKEALSKKPSSDQAKAKISELEKLKVEKTNQAEVDKKYLAAMKKGNESFVAKKYLDAIKYYNEALAIKPTEKEPVDRAAEAQRLEEANKSEIDKQYQKILEVGQNAIDDKNWDKAKEMYNRASNLRPDDVIPKNKLKEIEGLIKADQEAKMNAAEKEKAYASRITEGEQAASKKEYDKAIVAFQQAQSIKPDEKLPSKRIQELTELRDKESSLGKLESQYKDYIVNGDKALQTKDYDGAIMQYQGALSIKPNDKTTLAKIEEAKQLKDNDLKNQELSKIDEEFNKIVAEGDVLMTQEKWLDAKNTYEKALVIKNDKVVKKKYDDATKKARENQDFEKQYQKVIAAADENFGKVKYEKAKELYLRALSLKGADPYPQQKLDEIEAILNPKVIKQAEPLVSLGEKTAEDPEKVHEALVKAELERKSKKNSKLKSTSEVIQDNTTETTANKQTQILSSANSISEIEKKNQIRDDRADENRQNTLVQVDKKETEINSYILDAGNQKYNENVNNKEYVNNVTSESGKITTDRTAVYEENSKTMKVVTTSVEDENNTSSSNYYQSNIKSQGELAKTQIQVSDKVQDDFDSRKAVERGVNATKDSISTFDSNSISKESDNILNVSTEIEDQTKKRSIKYNEDAKLSGNNKEELKGIESGIVKQAISNTEKSTEKVLKTDEIVNANHKGQVGIADNQDKVRQSNVELIKDGNKQISESDGTTIQQNKTKNLENQAEISKNIVQLDAFKEVEVNSANQKFDAVENVNKQNASALVQNNMTDEEQRLTAKSTVSSIDQKNSSDVNEKGKKVDNNVSSMKTVTNEISTNKAKEDIEKDNQLKSSQGLLDKISSKQIKYDDKVANELGTLYPEGVSQEVFEQKDENGLLKAVVTRRVVVKNGYGQIYIRTQSLTGITYSKNGNPSSEFVWQKETQDSKLAKNY